MDKIKNFVESELKITASVDLDVEKDLQIQDPPDQSIAEIIETNEKKETKGNKEKEGN